MIVLSRKTIEKFKARFPTLVEFGLMDDRYAVAVLAADRLGCRPCDVDLENVKIVGREA